MYSNGYIAMCEQLILYNYLTISRKLASYQLALLLAG